MKKPLLLILASITLVVAQKVPFPHCDILSYVALPNEISLFWKGSEGKLYGTFNNIKEASSGELIFAMNGGMYKRDCSPVGLYVEKGRVITPIDKSEGAGNFYLKPNGVFYLRKDSLAAITVSESYVQSSDVKFATQSGPMLVIDGKVHKKFNKDSQNSQIRNGVGILPDGRVLFALSKVPVTFYDFSMFFINNGCSNALYLDGYVSRAYLLAEKWEQHDGVFGVIIAVIK